jgi:hypothetical protein
VLKSVVVHDIPIECIAAMERWYWREHAPEINRRFGPWLARHESFLPVDAPADARAFGYFNWRVTEGYWREMPLPGARGQLAFTVPPVWPRVATGFFAAQPGEDFCGGQIQPAERQVLRWYCLTRYPPGVDEAEAERWFCDVHGPELAALGNPYRAFSTRAHREPLPLPGEWPAGKAPPMDTVQHDWQRLTELWFESFADWRAFIAAARGLTPPPWAGGTAYPWLRPGAQIVSSFLLERPTDEFSRDARGYL